MSHLRIAGPDDLALLLHLRDHVEDWLAQRGADQFQDDGFAAQARGQIETLVEQRRFVILTHDHDETLAAGALTGPDMDFWTEDDDLNSAWYISRLMVAKHGQGYGAQLIDLIALAAALDGRTWLRLDCWRTNHDLHAYYENNGFHHVRTVEAPHRLSGALFQRPTSARLPKPWDESPPGHSESASA